MLLNSRYIQEGQALKVFISSERPCYPYVFSLGADGRVYRLLPNPIIGTFLLKGTTQLPTPKMAAQGYEIRVYPVKDLQMPQQEEILFICTRRPVNALVEYFPCLFAEDKDQLKRLLQVPYGQGVEIFNDILNQLSPDLYDMIDETYQIVTQPAQVPK
jgi:hypothetical protein